MKVLSFFLIVVLISSSTTMMMAFADSSRVVISVEEDSFADKSRFYNPQSLSIMTGFGGTRTEFVLPDDNKDQKPNVVSNDVLPITAYLKFDLNSIPSSTLLETVNIEESKLRLFFTSSDDSDAKLYVLTVSYCANNQWSDDSLTWDNRPCEEDIRAIDSVIVDEENIPNFVELDIVGAINKVKEKGNSKITLVLDARPILFDVEYNSSDIGKVTNFIQNNWGNIQLSDFKVNKENLSNNEFQGKADRKFKGVWKDYLAQDLLNMKNIDVRFVDGNLYSLNYSTTNSHVLRIASLESGQLGHATSPTLIVNYNVMPSVFNNSIIFTLTVILPTLTIIVPVALWMYRKNKYGSHTYIFKK